MPIAIECYFDLRTEARIRRLRSALHDQGVPWQPGSLDARPHISLALIREDAEAPLLNLLHAYAGEQPPVDIQLHAVGTFPTPENVLFLSPAPSTALLAAHQVLHDRLKETGFASSPYYFPEGWVPHCTIEMRIPGSLSDLQGSVPALAWQAGGNRTGAGRAV